MKNITKLIAGLMLVVGYSTSASALNISPGSEICNAENYPAQNGGKDSAFLTYCGITSAQVYKQDVAGQETGSLAGSYTSVFNGDQSGGTITWVTGTDFLACSSTFACYLLVKDGATSPYRYLFDLSLIWDGKAQLVLSNFWPGTGAISHWALYGGSTPGDDDEDLPEPGTLALLGLGLMGLGWSRRRR